MSSPEFRGWPVLRTRRPPTSRGGGGAVEIRAGEVQTVSIKRNIPFDSNVIIFINVQGERSSKQVRTDATGQVT
ncbi:hypothetical protein H7H51_01680, partial [Mycolicibacterium farcinogenes]|nr:hypothetical protein [Mycolicibacterium farcinogenes]